MALKDKESVRLAKVARDLQVGVGTLVEYLQRNGVVVENSPNAKIDGASYAMLQKEYGATDRPKGEGEDLPRATPGSCNNGSCC